MGEQTRTSKRGGTVELNHLTILAREKQKTAEFLAQLLDLPDATAEPGPTPDFFLCLRFDNDVMVLICEAKEHPPAHYAFKVTGDHFERILLRLKKRNIDFWADPRMQRKSEVYNEYGNRGLYVIDPSGHGLEVLTTN